MKTKRQQQSLARRILDRVKRFMRTKREPEDPYAYVTAPLRRPPRGRSGAAVAELDEQ